MWASGCCCYDMMFLFILNATEAEKVVSYLLHHLEPALFPEEPADDAWFKGHELDLFCFALRVHQEAFLPTETHEMDTIIVALIVR